MGKEGREGKREGGYKYQYVRIIDKLILYMYSKRQNPLPLPFNETEWNEPFNETERAVHDPFFIRSRSVHIFHPF